MWERKWATKIDEARGGRDAGREEDGRWEKGDRFKKWDKKGELERLTVGVLKRIRT